MLEDNSIQAGNIDDREDSDETRNDGPEEEFIPPDIVHPLRENGVLCLLARVQCKERAAHMHHLPSQEEGEPRQTSECRGAGTEDGIALVGIRVVATSAETIVARAVNYEDEGGQAKSCDPDTVDDHINHNLDGEDAALEVVGWAAENV